MVHSKPCYVVLVFITTPSEVPGYAGSGAAIVDSYVGSVAVDVYSGLFGPFGHTVTPLAVLFFS